MVQLLEVPDYNILAFYGDKNHSQKVLLCETHLCLCLLHGLLPLSFPYVNLNAFLTSIVCYMYCPPHSL